MYVRQPSGMKAGIKIPENYNGHAFSNSKSYSDMPPPIRQSPLSKQPPQGYDLPPEETDNTQEGVQSQAAKHTNEEIPISYQNEVINDGPHVSQPIPTSATVQENNRSPSLFSSLLPPLGKGESRFPFGHGIGSEELLILAMMLLVYLSDTDEGSGDHELLLLLGLLLFAG